MVSGFREVLLYSVEREKGGEKENSEIEYPQGFRIREVYLTNMR